MQILMNVRLVITTVLTFAIIHLAHIPVHVELDTIIQDLETVLVRYCVEWGMYQLFLTTTITKEKGSYCIDPLGVKTESHYFQ